jgi:hypothetical protein
VALYCFDGILNAAIDARQIRAQYEVVLDCAPRLRKRSGRLTYLRQRAKKLGARRVNPNRKPHKLILRLLE